MPRCFIILPVVGMVHSGTLLVLVHPHAIVCRSPCAAATDCILHDSVETGLLSMHTTTNRDQFYCNAPMIRPQTFIKLKSNTTNNDLPWRFGLYQRPSSEENEATILDRASDRGTRWIKEAVHTAERRDEVLWTGMRAATHWATRTTDFLPCHITTVATTRKRISFIFFWRRPLIETETSR